MANIKTHLNNIKGALFGKDVRGSIHDGIDAINKEVEGTTKRQVDLESTFDELIINAGSSNAEIVDARVKNDGTSYSKLGDRLDAVDSQLEQKMNEINEQFNTKVNRDEILNGLTYKGSCSYNDLPQNNNSIGDYWYCYDGDGSNPSGNYRWNGSTWDFGGTGDEGYSSLSNVINSNISFTWVGDYYINKNNGEQISTALGTYVATDFIEIKNNFKIEVTTYMNGDNAGLCYYDENKKFIIGLNFEGKQNLIIPVNAKYIRFSCLFIHSSKAMIKYIDLTKSILELENNKNIIKNDIENLKYVCPVKSTVELNDINKNVGYFINAVTNSISPLATYYYTDSIKIQKGDVIEVTNKDLSGEAVATISKWSEDGNTLLSVIAKGSTVEETYTYICESDLEYIRFCGMNSYDMKIKKNNLTSSEPLKSHLKNLINKEYIYSLLDGDFINGLTSKKTFLELSMFDDIAVCGDSYTAGAIYEGSLLKGEYPKTSWGKVLERITGSSVTIYASSGADTKTFQERDACLPKLLSDNIHGLYVLALGINDRDLLQLGTIEDIKDDYTQNENSFYGNYGKIISQIKIKAPNSKIIIVKSLIPTYFNKAYYNYSSLAIEEIASHFGIAYCETVNDVFLCSELYNTNIKNNGGHPTPPTYAGIAKSMKYLLSKTIEDNINYFSTYLNS